MKHKDYLFIKNELDKSWLLSNYLTIVCVGDDKDKKDFKTIKILFNDKVVTITENIGFAYLVSWWCDGSITSSVACELDNVCYAYNERF